MDITDKDSLLSSVVLYKICTKFNNSDSNNIFTTRLTARQIVFNDFEYYEIVNVLVYFCSREAIATLTTH